VASLSSPQHKLQKRLALQAPLRDRRQLYRCPMQTLKIDGGETVMLARSLLPNRGAEVASNFRRWRD
jgi:hypothetical protein